MDRHDGVIALNFGHGPMFGLQSAYFPELFGARVRYSGASFGFQPSAAIGGGLRRSSPRRWAAWAAPPACR